MVLHTKYQGSRPCGFRQEDFFMFLPIKAYGQVQIMCGISVKKKLCVECMCSYIFSSNKHYILVKSSNRPHVFLPIF